MRFRMLGSLEIHDGDDFVVIRGHNQQRLLRLLAINANDAVPVPALVDAVWATGRPSDPVHALHTMVTGARQHIAACRASNGETARIDHLGWAYRLSINTDEIDTVCFEHLVATGRELIAAQEAAAASAVLSEALGLWRGPALGEVASEFAFQAEAVRLENLRLAALELRIDTELGLGRHAELVGGLEALVSAHPTDEGLCGRLMVALYRSGRQVEALRRYRDLASQLAEQLGIDPTPALQDVEQAILEQRAALDDPTVSVGKASHRH